MSEQIPADEEVLFGEQLLGMQGFSAGRARKYRAELEKLLVHRITKQERWWMGFMGVFFVMGLGILAAGSALNRARGTLPVSVEMRWATAASFMLAGLIMGAWFLCVAVRGGYSRRVGDVMAMMIVLGFSGSFAGVFLWLACDAQDETTRTKLLLGGGTLAAFTVACIAMAVVQRMHRETQEKLLRIEYHLAELMERAAASR
jgi:hypothetical protein